MLPSAGFDSQELAADSSRRRQFFRWAAGVSVVCFSCALILSATAEYRQSKLLERLDESDGKWIFVPRPSVSSVEPSGLRFESLEDASEPSLKEGVNWGTLDCGFHGPAFESRALGCDRPGGCGATPVEKRSNTLDACGANSHFCISSFKTCIKDKGATGTSKPNYNICDCYLVLAGLGEGRCDDACTTAIFNDYGELTERCFNFDAFQGCLYLDRYRDPADRKIFARRDPPSADDDADADAEADAAAKPKQAPAKPAVEGLPTKEWPHGKWPHPWQYPYGTKDSRNPGWNRGLIPRQAIGLAQDGADAAPLL